MILQTKILEDQLKIIPILFTRQHHFLRQIQIIWKESKMLAPSPPTPVSYCRPKQTSHTCQKRKASGEASTTFGPEAIKLRQGKVLIFFKGERFLAKIYPWNLLFGITAATSS